MRIGIFTSDGTLDQLVEVARKAEADGFDSLWLPQIFGIDALCAHTLIGHSVPRIELGTAVVPTYPRHPAALAAYRRAGFKAGEMLNMFDGQARVVQTGSSTPLDRVPGSEETGS